MQAPGHVEGVILDKGRIVSTWRYKRGAGPLKITLDPHQRLSKHVLQEADVRFRAIARFLEHDDILLEQKSSSGA